MPDLLTTVETVKQGLSARGVSIAQTYAERRQDEEDHTPEGMRRVGTERAAFWDGC